MIICGTKLSFYKMVHIENYNSFSFIDIFHVRTVLTVENMDSAKFSKTKNLWEAIINKATEEIPDSTENIELDYKPEQDGKSGKLTVDIKQLDTKDKEEINSIIDNGEEFRKQLNEEIAATNADELEDVEVTESTNAIITEGIDNFLNAIIMF